MLRCSGGRLSPRLSRSLLLAHSSWVGGLTASPTELRKPRANPLPCEPSGSNCDTAARRLSVSSQMLHDEPTDTYSLPSGPNTTVRVEWPPAGRLGTITTGVVEPGLK